MALPVFKDDNQNLMLMQNRWSSELNPVLANPFTNPSILKGVNLVVGSNTINHGLGAKLQGWVISDITAASTIYRSAPLNDLTLTLTSSAACTADIVVF